MNYANMPISEGVLPKLLETKQVIMNRATNIVINEGKSMLKADLAMSQFRHDIVDILDEPFTFIAHPVFDSLDLTDATTTTPNIGGVLTTNIHWTIFFQRLLPPNAIGYICVLENSYNQTLAFVVNGMEAQFIGTHDPHDPAYDHLEETANINSYLQARSSEVS